MQLLFLAGAVLCSLLPGFLHQCQRFEVALAYILTAQIGRARIHPYSASAAGPVFAGPKQARHQGLCP